MKKKIALLLCATTVVASLCTACDTNGGVTSSSNSANEGVLINNDYAKNTIVMTIDGYDVTVEHLNLFLIQYIFNYGLEADTLTPEKTQEIINAAIDEIKLETVEYRLALVTDGVEVSNEAIELSKKQSDGFYNYFGEEFLTKYGISKEAVDELFMQQAYIEALKNKSMTDLCKDYLESFKEQYEDLQFFTMYYVLFPSVKYEDGVAVTNSDGSYVSCNEAEMADQLALANELYEKAMKNVADGEKDGNLEELAKEYGIDNVSKTEHGYYGAYSDELNELVESLTDGDISEVVETDAGYMIVRMDNSNDEEFKDYSIGYMAEQSAESLYTKLQENWMSASGAGSISANSASLADLKLEQMCKDMNDKGYRIDGGSQ